MRNTKKVIAATAAVATLVGLAACGSSNDNGANKGDADKAELVFWGWDSGNSMKEILADFEKANPGITVKFNNTGTAEKTSTALSNAIAAGNGAPDVVMLEDPSRPGTTTTRPPRRSVPPAPTSPIWPVPPTTISRSPPRSGRPVPSRGRSMARTSPST